PSVTVATHGRTIHSAVRSTEPGSTGYHRGWHGPPSPAVPVRGVVQEPCRRTPIIVATVGARPDPVARPPAHRLPALSTRRPGVDRRRSRRRGRSHGPRRR